MPHPWPPWKLSKTQPAIGENGVRLNYRTIFILPEPLGVVYGLMAMTMIVGSLNFAINPAVVLACLFTSILLVALTQTHRNLLGLMILPAPPIPVFAGERIPVGLVLKEMNRRPRFTLGLKSPTVPETARLINLDAKQTGYLEHYLPPHRRGPMHTGRLTLYSRFPLGLIIAWSHFELAKPIIVYPKPEPKTMIPPSWDTRQGQGEGAHGPAGDDFIGLENWQPGDSPRKIHWKASAQHSTLLVKRFEGTTSEKTWLRWEDTGLTEVEARLSRLCRWVLNAEEQGQPYGLILPNVTIPPGIGDAHRHRCLEALAMFPQS
ncbi:MAG: hypothetical protein HW380_3490 [Magnetococcales bacterium]|nr:hypothetical protein [Magnetococcales bacterium]HIJ85121.1 DUF58 domain-containing protein [Magnetococcales bacterium]